jgi:hypothetical protein
MSEPLRILGLVKDEVGAKREENGLTHNQYSIPFELSRSVTGDESKAITQTWYRVNTEREVRITVEGATLTILNTSIEQVRDRLASQIRAVLRQVHSDMEAADLKKAQKELAESRHREHVDAIAQQIDWS